MGGYVKKNVLRVSTATSKVKKNAQGSRNDPEIGELNRSRDKKSKVNENDYSKSMK